MMFVLFLETIFLAVSMSYRFFGQRPHMLYQVKETAVDRLLVCGFMFNMLGVSLFLLLAVAVVSEAKMFSNILVPISHNVFGCPYRVK